MSLAYLDPHPILDGNVKRVISRFLKKELDLLKEAELWKLSEEMINRDDCFSYTQGIMDLGATLCKPSNPSCENVRLILNAYLHSMLVQLKKIKMFE